MKKLLFFFILIHGFCFSQDLEESIYVAAETFMANPNESSLQTLTQQELEFKTQVKTKDEQLALVFLQSHKGYYLDTYSRLKEAIATYEDAVKRFNDNDLSKLSDFDIIESCMIPLGNLYTKTGDFTNALNTINQYVFLAEQHKNFQHQISGAINLSKLYYTIGEHDLVIIIVDKALKIPNISNPEREQLLYIKNNSLIKSNELASFEEEVNALDTEQTYKLHLTTGNYEKALTEFQEYKKKIFTNKELSRRQIAQVYIEEAQVYFVNNNSVKAKELLQLALRTLLPDFKLNRLPDKALLYEENKFIDIFDLYAEIETNPEEILKSYDLSFYVSDLLKSNWTTQKTKTLNESNNRIRSEKCIDLLFNMFQKTKDATLLVKAFEYSENTKVFTLKETFQMKQRLEKHPTDSLLILEYQLIKKQERITSKLVIEELENNRASEINRLSKQLSDISLKLKSLKPPILKKYGELESFISITDLQKKLHEDNAVLVEYFYGKNMIYQFIISSSTIELNEVAETKNAKTPILEFIHLFDDAAVINNDISSYTSKAHQLYKLLKLDAVSKWKNVIIVPDSFLNFIPFETLLSEETKTSSFSKMPFVVKSQNIVYNSSACFYTTEITPKSNANLLGVFPVFENTNRALTFSLNEAAVIQDETTSDVLFNENATKLNFLKKAPNYGLLHLSTHASSGTSRKPANIEFYDNTLYVDELYGLDLNPNLVVLSACETGIGKLYKAEGAMSISRGFQYSGAKNLLFSLWQINDLSTSQIMQSFYKNFGDTQSAFLANQNSKLEYLQNESISNSKKSPYYWGAFVYYGDLSYPDSRPYLWYVIIFGLVFFIIVFLRSKFK
ncbi:CHAT domain-containing protein [Seonamhaeicola sp. ML3]|uniref:CHAT domain-containing protein n=1 Tax=Seonamhaeicola sp. ML3 TaxID=2937786 RepID=UPI00200BBDB2|nr:CHAT domain-containing protein [Seonamhaeicola sp. ML3]